MTNRFDAVIFDWAGTTVDYGCFAPVQAFIEAFREFGVEPTMDETRQPMRMWTPSTATSSPSCWAERAHRPVTGGVR